MAAPTKRFVFIGAGNMAEALVKGLIAARIAAPKQITACDVSAPRLAWIHDEYGINVEPSNETAVRAADIIILAVKPQVLLEVVRGIAPAVPPAAIVISIAAGMTTAKIEHAFGAAVQLVRAMPNTPALVQRGVTALCCGSNASPAALVVAQEIFHAVGSVLVVKEELMDVITAVSGSGPAYAFYLMEAMLRVATANGLPAEEARHLVAETIRGAGELAASAPDLPEELRRRVTSPGGTTEAAIKILDAKRVNAALQEAINAAVTRSRELAR